MIGKWLNRIGAMMTKHYCDCCNKELAEYLVKLHNNK